MSQRHELLLAGMACVAALGCRAPAEPEGGLSVLDPDAGWIEGADGVAVRAIWAPPQHWILDMNSRGDLLLSTLEQSSEGRWLLSGASLRPRGRRLAPAPHRYQKPNFLPFSGRSLNERGEVLGPGTTLYRNGTVIELPDPCPAEVRNDMTLDCYIKPIKALALADNSDVPVSIRKDYIATNYSPYWQLRVWRATAGEWVTLVELWGEGMSIPAVISPGGLVAAKLTPASPPFTPVLLLFPPVGQPGGVQVTGLCPAPFPDPGQATPVAVNDAGDLIAEVTCYGTSGNQPPVSVFWRRGQLAVFLDGVGMFVDSAGNVVGQRAGDGHFVVWMADGGLKDLSVVVASAGPVVLKKILPGQQIFGTVERRGVVWRY